MCAANGHQASKEGNGKVKEKDFLVSAGGASREMLLASARFVWRYDTQAKAESAHTKSALYQVDWPTPVIMAEGKTPAERSACGGHRTFLRRSKVAQADRGRRALGAATQTSS